MAFYLVLFKPHSVAAGEPVAVEEPTPVAAAAPAPEVPQTPTYDEDWFRNYIVNRDFDISRHFYSLAKLVSFGTTFAMISLVTIKFN